VIIQPILISGLLGLLLYAVLQYRRSRLLSAAMVVVSLSGILLVMSPQTTDVLAHAVGVGRGTDLIVYCFILVALIAIFNLHLRLRAASEVTTALARAIALIAPKEPTAVETHLADGGEEQIPAGVTPAEATLTRNVCSHSAERQQLV
jgi:hypothetical protein